MSSQFWKVPRSNVALASQWARRVHAPLPFILGEVNQRMVNRAQIMRPVEGGVVHQGWLHPDALPNVKDLLPGRPFSIFSPAAIDLPGLQVDPAAASFLSKIWPGRTAARAATRSQMLAVNQPLPLPDESQAMVWSPLWLHAVEDPGQCLAEWLRVLKPEGGVFFSCFGPDTARELKSFADMLQTPFPDFSDMHDLGDLMSRQGFSDPVMEMEKLTLTYATPEKLLGDWRAMCGNNLQNMKPGLMTARAKARAVQSIEKLRNPENGRIPLTLELVYGHAWKVKRQPKTGVATVKVSDIKGRKGLK
ncbi:MAG TPA: methyltransferase domain-containing protein [Limnobacter sp.]|nr:methyltransferase domain-containing protein [Limnobacter sp.]